MALPKLSASEGVVNTQALPASVFWGSRCKDALPEALKKLNCCRAFLMVSRSLRSSSPAIEEIVAALGDTCAGVWDGMPAHTPRDAVMEAAKEAKKVDADVIVTIGGGSLTDGAKVVRIALQTNTENAEELGQYCFKGDVSAVKDTKLIPQICVPTTLSAGEFAPYAGCTDPLTKVKETFVWLDALPKAIVLDPWLAQQTPEWLFLSTGLRSVDHCVECLCSPSGNPYSDGLAGNALAMLVSGLRGVKADPSNLESRTQCQLGIFQAVQACQSGPKMGASHAIGHILGPAFEVPHGYTSCVALPAVLRWNAQDEACLGRQGLVVDAFTRAGCETDEAGSCVAALVAELGLPGSLAEVKVARSELEECARRTMHDPLVQTNPRKIAGWEDVKEILELCGPFAEK
ncbi:unnamed protein product [Effrenium voratum]|uniref:Alcohol dehydrogenase iron-type/glycerol dehydrogenase GldA domain-containing protein n=1 Tax=Effrenium voratum TaxID=2562239 RepID=A0AA36HW19_9DINO|nr:unnamed protein product [Effrenium voratum]